PTTTARADRRVGGRKRGAKATTGAVGARTPDGPPLGRKQPVGRKFFYPRMVRPLVNVVLVRIDAMPSDAAQALEPFRSYLEVLPRVRLDPRLRGKLDPADVVQQALLRAYAAWPEMKNPDQPVLTAWLRRILARTLADVVKHYDRDKRAVD